jgi:hypothetical protein
MVRTMERKAAGHLAFMKGNEFVPLCVSLYEDLVRTEPS